MGVEDNMIDFIMCKIFEETRNIDNINIQQMHNIFNNTDNTISPMNSERNLNAGSRSNQNKGTHTPSHYRFSTKQDDFTNPTFSKYAQQHLKESGGK